MSISLSAIVSIDTQTDIAPRDVNVMMPSAIAKNIQIMVRAPLWLWLMKVLRVKRESPNDQEIKGAR
jgi:hypothetical protein